MCSDNSAPARTREWRLLHEPLINMAFADARRGQGGGHAGDRGVALARATEGAARGSGRWRVKALPVDFFLLPGFPWDLTQTKPHVARSRLFKQDPKWGFFPGVSALGRK